MSPLGATTTSDGPCSISPSPGMPALPSVISALPSGVYLMTTAPLPFLALSSLTYTLPSRSTPRPCGKLNVPAPKLVRNLPAGSNFMIGATFELAQLFAPQRSKIHTLLPSRSTSTPIGAPIFLPSGSFAQLSSNLYGLGAELG